jgi:hypothetical protein
MSTSTIGDCSDLYDNAAEELKRLDYDIDKIIRDLANKVEARGVPKNRVARQVVKELTARDVLSPTRIYEGLGIESKRKYVKRVTEETFPQSGKYSYRRIFYKSTCCSSSSHEYGSFRSANRYE